MRLRTSRALVASSLAGLLAAAAMLAYQPTATALTGGPQIQQECADPAWDSGTVYTGGDRVSHDGRTWRAQWGIYDRDFLVRDVHDTGQAGNLTHIHYAFGNVNSDGECFMANQLGEGDAWADY